MSTPNSPCAACKIQRRKCTQECIFAPYFPPDQPQKFANVHKVFGASNIAKLLNELNTAQREDAVNSLAYEAEARLRDPVYGCVGLISILQHRLKELQTDLYNAKKELAQYIGPQAMLPTFQSSPYMAAAQNHMSNPIMGTPTGVVAHGGHLVFREPQQQNQHQNQIFESQQQLAVALAAREQQEEIYRGYENQQQDQILMRFNGGFDCSNSVPFSSTTNDINNAFNQITVAATATVMSPCLALGTFDNNNHYQIQTEQEDHHQLQAHIFLQPRQQGQQSQQTQQQQRSGSDEGGSVGPSC